jgi:hypothetical protein
MMWMCCVLDAPEDLSTAETKIAYGVIGDSVNIVVTVRAVPEPTIHTVFFRDKIVSGIKSPNGIDSFDVTFFMKIVDYQDYKTYIIDIGNGIGTPTKIQVEINNRGRFS